MSEVEKKGRPENTTWWAARSFIIIALILLYGWTIFEPFAGDALMHMMDDTQIHSLRDVVRVFYSNSNSEYHEQYRLLGFHRPIFNELYITLVKGIFGVGSIWLRCISLTLFIGSGLIFMSFAKRLGFSPLISTVATAWLVFSPALFFGLYEYGLSFSVLLVFFAVSSLFFIKKYVDTLGGRYQYIWAFFAALFVFLTVFTKESAVVWPIVCSIIAIYFVATSGFDQNQMSTFSPFSIRLQVNAFMRIKWFVFLLLSFTLLYFYTRYLKLGSLTAVAGGIEQSPTLKDSLYKLEGYSLLALQIPTDVIPGYMTQKLSALSWQEICLRVILFVIAVIGILSFFYRQRYTAFILITTCIIAFLPIIKVVRNAPYYGDLMAIPVAILVGYGFNFFKDKNYLIRAISIISITFLFISASFFAYRYVFIPNVWLAQAQGWQRAAVADLSSIPNLEKLEKILPTSGIYAAGVNWSLNYSPAAMYGIGPSANLKIPRSIFSLNNDGIENEKQLLFIDFIPSANARRIGRYPLPAYGHLYYSYFPYGFLIKELEKQDDLYLVSGSKVLRFECGSALASNIVVAFKASGGADILRSVGAEMNLSKLEGKYRYDFVIPEGIEKIDFRDAQSCEDIKVYGYFDKKSS